MSDDKRGVLDPDWEDALRAGQEADGGKGSVESELAMLHLLRHARGPEPLRPDALDQVWSDMESEISREGGWTPWWKRMLDWRVGVGFAVASAAAVALFVAARPPSTTSTNDSVAQLPPARDAGMSATLEAQFDLLAPAARHAIGDSVDSGRATVRAGLLAKATGDETPSTIGGGR